MYSFEPFVKRNWKRVKWLGKWVLLRKTVILHADFTRQAVNHYCKGFGIEIGPGSAPYTASKRTIYVDKFDTRFGGSKRRILTDVIADGARLPFANAHFDYLFSSHMLEHAPNTIAVLQEWMRIVKPGGILGLRLPHGDRTFDQGRPKTSVEHHAMDFRNNTGYEDTTHFEEWAGVLARNPQTVWLPAARKADGTLDFGYIVSNGLIHYHVWSASEFTDLLRYLGLRIEFAMDKMLDYDNSFIVFARLPHA